MIEHRDAIGELSRVVIRQKEAAGAETDIFGLQKRLRQQEVGRRMRFPWSGMRLADPGFLVAEFIEPAQHLQVEVVPLFQPALRRMRGHREISDFHRVSSLLCDAFSSREPVPTSLENAMQFSQRVFARKREYSTPRVRRRYDKASGASACGATLASPPPLWERVARIARCATGEGSPSADADPSSGTDCA